MSKALAVGGLLILTRLLGPVEESPEPRKFEAGELVFNSDGSLLAIDTSEGVMVWDVEKQRKVAVYADGFGVPLASFSPDGEWFAAGQLRSLNGELPWQDTPPDPLNTLRPPMAFVADGRTFLAVTPSQVVRSNRLPPFQLREIREITNDELIDVLVVGPRGQQVAIAGKTIGDRSFEERSFLEVWDISGHEPKRTAKLKGHIGSITSLDFSKDGKRLLSASWDETVRMWDLKTGKTIRTFRGHVYIVYFAHFSEDEKRIYSGSFSHEVREWDAESGKVLRKAKDKPLAVVTRDGKRVAWSPGDGKVKIGEFGTGKLLQEIDVRSMMKAAK